MGKNKLYSILVDGYEILSEDANSIVKTIRKGEHLSLEQLDILTSHNVPVSFINSLLSGKIR